MRCRLNDTVSVTLWSSTLQKLCSSYGHPRYFQIHSALNWHGAMQYIRYSEPCSKSSKLYMIKVISDATVSQWRFETTWFVFPVYHVYDLLCWDLSDGTVMYVSARIDKWTVSLSNAHFKIAFSMSEIDYLLKSYFSYHQS